MAPKRLVVKAMKDENSIWAWQGGYIEHGIHLGRPCFQRDRADGGAGYYIFYHPTWDAWFFGPSLPNPRSPSISFSTQSKGAAESPEEAKWPTDKVQSITLKSMEPTAAPGAASLFVDPEFPHSVASISLPGGRHIDLGHGEPEWIPGRQLREGTWALFDGIDPTDLLQGRLGDCWLIAAIAALAEYPQEVKKIFRRDGLQKGDGRYVLRLLDHKKEDAAVRDVTVDEFVPCKPKRWWDDEAEPYFAKPNGNELWCLILEKAMAKVFGSYGELTGGTPAAAFRAITGQKKQFMWTAARDRSKWGKATLADGSVSRFTSPGSGQETKTPDEFWAYLRDCDQKNYLMAASIKGGREAERRDGLVEGHAYSLVTVIEVDSGTPLRLLELRNPWGGDKEWNGPWGDKHPIWNKYKDVKAQLRPTFGNDGAFWMDWDSFSNIFTDVCVCPHSMREGTEAEDHRLASLDWRKYKPKPPDPKPPSISTWRRPPERVDDTKESAETGAGAAAGEDADLKLCKWQVQLTVNNWEEYPEEDQAVFKAALAAGEKFATLNKKRGAKTAFEYEINFVERVQRNKQTGKVRLIRPVQSSGPAPADDGYHAGQAVHIWSESAKTWFEDGTVVEVLAAAGKIDAMPLAAGSVKVEYDKRTKTKWVEPSAFPNKLRHAPGAAPAADRPKRASRHDAAGAAAPATAAAPAAATPADTKRVESEGMTPELERLLSSCPSKDFKDKVAESARAGARVVLEVKQSPTGWKASAELITVISETKGHRTSTRTSKETVVFRWT